MAAPTIRQASPRPSRREPPPWSSRVEGGRVERSRAEPPPRRRTPFWRTALAPVTALAVALAAAGAATVFMGGPRGAPTSTPPRTAATAAPRELSATEAVRLRFLPELTAAIPGAPGRGDGRPDFFADRFGTSADATTGLPADDGPVSAYAPAPSWPSDQAGPQPGRPRPSNALLNDAQIASIKGRLKLTTEQQKLWPDVEAALRGVVWRRAADRRSNAPATLDAQSVERLKSAAAPLMGKLREDQKREIRTLTHVMGLGDFAEKL